MTGAILIDHPLIKHKLTLLRKKETPPAHFRIILKEISFLLAFEVTKGLELENIDIETPVSRTSAPQLSGRNMCIFSILRAGEGLAQGMLELIPSARVGHVGLYRDEDDLHAVEYYFKAPSDLADRFNLVVDPMLATGGSAITALNKIKKEGAKNITFLCLLAAPEGIKALNDAHPDVQIYTASIDERLNEKSYIVPGLGDAGDRIFGTV
ncbi:MAG: uracil phosphoribosyltransferase [Kordiimonadaceae bacterium]|jgi:uracil phosphoribosyltransferase|nr:uracil phosphoribosyltransferase [Kordiimonadaceae bacterium]MBT6035808.1 uracil phosphoribosyltransferase [Kordiimonadaceae bacterium]MBT6330218.1 uracil phosphoribosyltransferase [Kordiimonadaceae bacterium]MBT7582057.1 uracil phosphoribosyltransferase [Kordiimonadaceae bacterium]